MTKSSSDFHSRQPGEEPEAPSAYSIDVCVAGPKRASEEECQDYSQTWEDSEGRVRLIVVADGHGSPKYHRSRDGARFACECTIDLVRSQLQDVPDSFDDFSVFKAWWEKAAFPAILDSWTDRVIRDDKERVLSEGRCPSETDSPGDGTQNWSRRVHYGTTLLVGLSMENQVALGQVGDGLVGVIGQQVGFPLVSKEHDHDDTRSETESLCSHEPKYTFKALRAKKPPRLLFLCTDGLDDAFSEHARLREWLEEFSRSEELSVEGDTRAKLEKQLREISTFSGDDTTFAIIFDPRGDQLIVEAQPDIEEPEGEGKPGEDDSAVRIDGSEMEPSAPEGEAEEVGRAGESEEGLSTRSATGIGELLDDPELDPSPTTTAEQSPAGPLEKGSGRVDSPPEGGGEANSPGPLQDRDGPVDSVTDNYRRRVADKEYRKSQRMNPQPRDDEEFGESR